jgi:AraC family transcriptional regulator
VPLEQCRYDVGLEIPEDVAVDGDVSVGSFAACTAAEIELSGSIELELRALHWLFLDWLPGSGYAPADQPMFEAWNGRPFAHGFEHFEFRVQLPVARDDVPL